MAKLGPNSLTQVFTEIKNWVVSKLSSKANDNDVVHTTGNEIVEGTKTFSSQIKGNISGSSTSCTGNSASATKLATARTISLTGAVTGSVSFNGSANASISTTLSNIDASKITSGTIDIARIPKAALAELKIVADDDARFALTTADIQNGDTVKVESTGKMYYVKDQTKLSTEDGYAVYTADQASSVDWSGVINKPTTFTPSSHTHGKITNDGKIGTAANKPLITTTGGVVTTGSFGTAANTFCQGNDSRLSDARTPKAHTHAKSDITDFPTLATVATSGSYTDLSNKPTIPTVNNATLTIQKNGTTVKTFTANASANVTANITVPTKTSELTNDSGYITSGNIADTYATKTELKKGLNTKADTSHLHSQYPTVSNMSTSGVGCIALLAYFPSSVSDFSNNEGTTRPGSSLCEVYWRLSTSGSVSGSIYTGGDYMVIDKSSHKNGTWKQLNYTTIGYSQFAAISFWVRIS